MKAFALALLVALPAFADDVPVKVAPTQLCLQDADRLDLGRRLEALEGENASLRDSVTSAPRGWVVVLLVVAGVVAGGAAGVAVSQVALKK